MSVESPEDVLRYIMMHVRDVPQSPPGEPPLGENYQQRFQARFGDRLAVDFDYGDFWAVERVARDEERSANPFPIPPALIVNDDAYIYTSDGLIALIRDADGRWKLRIAAWTCVMCFGDHYYSGGGCWGVLCKCCGGTGWDDGSYDLDFCARDELPIDATLLTSTSSPREAFLHLQESRIPALQVIQDVAEVDVSPALVKGSTAKIEVTTPETRYFALMRKLPTSQWHLSAFQPLCSVCGGRVYTKNDDNTWSPCRGCAGLKWGQLSDLRYCRNSASDWWEVQE